SPRKSLRFPDVPKERVPILGRHLLLRGLHERLWCDEAIQRQVLAPKKFALPQCQGQIERRPGMLGILLPEIFEGASSVLIVKTIDTIETFRRTFLELGCFQILGEKCIRQAAQCQQNSCYAYWQIERCHACTQCKARTICGRGGSALGNCRHFRKFSSSFS